MNRRLVVTAVVALGFLALCTQIQAHDDKRLHKATVGEIVAVSADGMQLKTKTGMVTVKYSSKTTFELQKKSVDRSAVRQGDHAGVLGSKLPTGEMMANEVLLGLPAGDPHGAGKSTEKHGHK
jgi:hypothetical protein